MFHFIHNGQDFKIVLHLCILGTALCWGAFLRAKVRFFRKYLIPASMIGGAFLFIFYNFFADSLGLVGSSEFYSSLMYHLLNISFIALQLRVPEHRLGMTKKQNRRPVLQNVACLMAEYGMQCFFGLLVMALFFKKTYGGSSQVLGLSLCLGFELGPGQASSMSSVWESQYGVSNAGSVGLTMAAIGFIIGSVVGVFFINRAANRGWIPQEYADKLRNNSGGDGFFRRQKERVTTSRQTTATESIDSFSFHLGLVLFTYLLSFLTLAGIELAVVKLCPNALGGKLLDIIAGFWGINFVMSMLFATIVRTVILKSNMRYMIDNGTCNRIDGMAVDLTVAACLGAIKIAAIRNYLPLIVVLTVVGCIITCYVTPWFCSRMFDDWNFFRFLMIFGTANGTLPTALSLLRVIDPDFTTPAANDYASATGIMFFFALPILALINNPAKTGSPLLMLIVTGVYIVIAAILYFVTSGGRALAKPTVFFFTDGNTSEVDMETIKK